MTVTFLDRRVPFALLCAAQGRAIPVAGGRPKREGVPSLSSPVGKWSRSFRQPISPAGRVRDLVFWVSVTTDAAEHRGHGRRRALLGPTSRGSSPRRSTFSEHDGLFFT